MSGSKEEKLPHPTQKPVDLMRRSIVNHGIQGDGVYEPFGGSGTTLAACELTGRTCTCIEIEPRYCDVIVTRWQNLTARRRCSVRTKPPYAPSDNDRCMVRNMAAAGIAANCIHRCLPNRPKSEKTFRKAFREELDTSADIVSAKAISNLVVAIDAGQAWRFVSG